MPIEASYCMFIGAFFDFIDGLIARALKVASAIGKDLDSLADIITFGLLPGLIALNLVVASHKTNVFLSFVSLIIPLFSAIRLAKFNNDTEQSFLFKGLATPANGLFWACVNICYFNSYFTIYGLSNLIPAEVDLHRDFIPSQYAIQKDTANWLGIIINDYPLILVVAAIVLSFLLISNLKLMAFKFKGFGWKDNQWKYILLIVCLPLIIWLKFTSAPIILLLYIITSQIHFRTQKHEI